MLVLWLKLVLAPALVAGASLAGRRWGPAFSGWIVAMPLVSGPIALFLALEQGTSFAAAAAHGTLIGAAGQAGFCLAFAWSGRAVPWPVALASGTAGFAAGALAFEGAARLPGPTLAALLAAMVLLALSLMPAAAVPGSSPVSLGRWDIPARMFTAGTAVLGLTAAAPALGARFSGVLAAYPIITAVLAVFAHRQGAAHANAVLRGLLLGVFSFQAFYAVLEVTVVRAGIAGGFAAASAAALLVQAATAAILRGRAGVGASRA